MTPAGSPRLVALDGLRGVAVLGILLMNVNAFAMPFAAYDDPAAYGPMRPADVALWAIDFVFVDGKMRAIFSALFGASLLLVAERAEATGRSAARTGCARLATLLLFGLAHACLIWDGDILVLYALIGFIALSLRSMPVERLLVLAGMLLAAQAAVLALHYQALAALEHAAVAPGAPRAAVTQWRAVAAQIGRPPPGPLAADLALHRGPWHPLAATLIAGEPASIVEQVLFAGPETLGLMLLGMAGLRTGFLAGAWPRERIRAMARVGYALGIPPLIALAWLLARNGFPPLMTATVTDLVTMPLRWLVAAGHAALIVAALGRAPAWLRTRVVAAGRVAFSNYLGTSLVMAAVFDGWGLGLYGRIERWMLVPFVLATWALMLAWSRPWLARVAYGPLEWLWRTMARGRVVPLRRVRGAP